MAGRAFVLLYAHDTPLYRGLRMAERRVQQFAYNANRIGRSMLTLATSAALPLAVSVRTFVTFSDVMKEVQAVTGATGQQFDLLYEKAKKLGATTSFTAGQVGEGMANLGRQGFKSEEIDAAVPSVLNLARATKTELAVSATIAAGTLRALNMEAREMPRVADVLTATANNSAQTLEELGDTMKYAAPIADEMGLSIEQTAKAIGVLANMQIKGTMAGTSLRKIMGDLAGQDTQKKLHDIHVETLNLDRSMRPLGDVMVDIGQAMARMTNAERISFAQDLFGDRAYGAALKLSKGGFEDLAAAIDNAGGTAERTADLMDSGLGGTLRILMSAIEGVQIAIGEALDEQLTAWGTTATEIAGKIQKWIELHKELIVTVAKIVTGLAAFGVAMIAVGAVAGSIAATINLLSMAVAAFTTLLALNPMTLLLGSIAAVGVAMYSTAQHTARLHSEMSELVEANDAVRTAQRERIALLAELAENEKLSSAEMQTAKTIIAELTDKYGDLGLKVDEAAGSIEGLTEAQRRLNKEQADVAKIDLEAAIAEEMANIEAMREEMLSDAAVIKPWEYSWGWLKDLSDPAGEGGIYEGEQRQMEARAAAIAIRQKELDALLERYRKLVAGDEGAITAGVKGDVQPERSEAQKQRQADRLRFARLKELAARQKEGLSGSEIAEAAGLVDQLGQSYGDLGLRVVEAAGRILGMKDAQDKFNATMQEASRQEMLDEIGKTLGLSTRPAPKDSAEQLAAGEITSEQALKMNEEMQDRISEYRIQRIKDEQDRTIAEINRRYEAERKKAEELGASLSMVEEARKAAIATADEKYGQQQEEERNRKKEAADASNQQMRRDIARIEIEKASGQEIQKAKAAGASAADIKELELDRERKLLELQRQQALEDAKKQGLDLKVVNELYDARLAMTDQQAQQDRFAEIARGRRQLREAALAPTAQMGSLEAYQAIARHGDPALRIQENQLRKLADIEHNTARAADAAEEDGYEEVGLDD